MTRNLCAIAEWVAEGKYSLIPLSRIKEPRKEFNNYQEGEYVKASCYGFPGIFDAILLELGGKDFDIGLLIHNSKQI